jgi:hypothetical protein
MGFFDMLMPNFQSYNPKVNAYQKVTQGTTFSPVKLPTEPKGGIDKEETKEIRLLREDNQINSNTVAKYKTSTLLHEVRNMLSEGGEKVSEADILLQVLENRKLTTERKEQFKRIVHEFQRETKLCRMSGAYSGEFVGLRLKSDKPVNVYGTAILKVWKRWKRTKTNLSFPDYFTKYASNAEFAKAQRNKVRYLNAEEQKECEAVFVKSGNIRRGNTKRKFRPGNYMFVLENNTTGENTSKERLLLAKKHRGHFHHSSLSQGRACLSAGMMRLNAKGKIIHIQMDSGHYKPGSHQANALIHFLAQPKKVGSRIYNVPLNQHF